MKQLRRTGLFTLPCDDWWHLLDNSYLSHLAISSAVQGCTGRRARTLMRKRTFIHRNPTHLVSVMPLLTRSVFRLAALPHVLAPGQSQAYSGLDAPLPVFSAAGKRQADSSETKQFAIINEDIFHLIEKR